MWLFITLRERQPDAQQRMTQLVPELPLRDWPAMALGLFSNRVSMDEFLRSSWHPNQARRLRREAQAYFYAGQQWLYLGQTGEARDCFQKCVQLGIKDLNEYRMAKLRLQQTESEKTEKGN